MTATRSSLRLPRGPDRGLWDVLLVPSSNTLFHVARCVVLAKELAARGHRIHMAGSSRYLGDPEVARTVAFELHELPEFTPEEAMDILRSIVRVPPRERIEAMIDAEIELLERLRPDLAIADFRPTLSVSARLCGVPLAALQLGHWTPAYAHDPEWSPRSYPGLAPVRRLVGERAMRRLSAPLFRLALRRKTAPFRRAARGRGQPAPAYIWEHLRGDFNLLSDTESLCPAVLPPRTERVGPLLWEPETPLPPWVERLDPERPVVFVNYGSTAHPKLFLRTLDELAGSELQVILATCGQFEVPASRVPPNFFVERYLPVTPILEHADLAVYHGGAGTFHQVARAGVPALVIATHWDQEHAGFTSEKHGIGRFLTLREVLKAPGLLREAVDGLLERLSVHRERAGELREDLLACDGPKLASDRLEHFLAGVSPRTPRPEPASLGPA